ncbi:hypothetical protein PMAYCL1PPCAC_29639 [Pristionchus mayeri]|uniref:m7GpppX diphosphatase n=1 Tax=Pristionchus mayeri TaxID=1317129 RepID=A0AAN5ICC8_9BILA|nr:hypothetical protein PMAYCL1PPCAC_29639 [Pristionchus mayeri]
MAIDSEAIAASPETAPDLNPSQIWLNNATVVEVLGADCSHKNICVLLENNGMKGVLVASKSPFPEAVDQLLNLVPKMQVAELSVNDVYRNVRIEIPPVDNALSCSLIYPATEKHINKYRKEEKYIVKETPEDYETITKEWIQQSSLELDWVYNFIDGRSEAERVIFKDIDPQNGFVLAPDLKWNGEDMENLYLLAVVNRRGIKSVRDLTANDIPLLENVRDKGLAAIREKYNVRPDQMRVYFHYQPSFFHLHMHFVILSYDAPASSVYQAILLDDVINNIQMDSLYYKKATLSFLRKKNDRLLEMYRKAGRAQE